MNGTFWRWKTKNQHTTLQVTFDGRGDLIYMSESEGESENE